MILNYLDKVEVHRTVCLFANGEIYFMLLFLKIVLNKTPKNCLITLFTDKRKTKM